MQAGRRGLFRGSWLEQADVHERGRGGVGMTADNPPNTTRLCKLRNKASSSIASRVHSATAATPLYGKKSSKKELLTRASSAPSASPL